MKNSIKFILNPNHDEIKKVGKQSAKFLKSHGFSDSGIAAETMIINELIRNGKKFTKSQPPDNKMTVHLQVNSNTITVEVNNKVDESTYSQLEELDKTIQWIRGYQDPFEPYMIKLRETSGHPRTREANGLGLARIAYEAEATVDFFVNEDNILSLFAVRDLNGRYTC